MREALKLGLCLAASTSLFVACGPTGSDGSTDSNLSSDITQMGKPQIMPTLKRNASGQIVSAAASGPHLNYYGGPVIPNAEIFIIYWGNNAQTGSHGDLTNFYKAITQSAYFDWLNEYNTPSQHIGRGRYIGSYVDTKAPNKATLTNKDIANEVSRLLSAKAIPQPILKTPDKLYMVYFPPGVTITLDGATSCQQFCAYHNTLTWRGHDIYYGVFPDITSDIMCILGCGTDFFNPFNNLTAVSSHEMIEAVTDAAVGLVSGNNPQAPMAWYDPNTDPSTGSQYAEIGDICVGKTAVVAGQTVQLEWSNKANACIAHR